MVSGSWSACRISRPHRARHGGGRDAEESLVAADTRPLSPAITNTEDSRIGSSHRQSTRLSALRSIASCVIVQQRGQVHGVASAVPEGSLSSSNRGGGGALHCAAAPVICASASEHGLAEAPRSCSTGFRRVPQEEPVACGIKCRRWASAARLSLCWNFAGAIDIHRDDDLFLCGHRCGVTADDRTDCRRCLPMAVASWPIQKRNPSEKLNCRAGW